MKRKDKIKGFFQSHGLYYRDVAEAIGKVEKTVCEKVRKNTFEAREINLITDYIRVHRGERVDEIEICRAFGLLAS